MANNLTLTGGAFDSSTAKFGSALSGGTGSANVTFTSAGFTAEAWIKGGGSGPAVAFGNSTVFWVGTNSGNLVAYVGSGTNQAALSGGAYTGLNGSWHHVALTSGPGGSTLWLDGAAVGANVTALAGTGATFAAGLGLRNFEAGANFFGPFTWPGEVDELAVFSGIRYSAAFTPPASPYTGGETNLLALYHLDGTGTDSTGATPAPTIGAPAISGLLAGGTTTVNGTFANGTPTGLTYSLDGAAPITVSATIGSGTYSFTIVTPGAGTHTISVTGTGPNTATSGPTGFTAVAVTSSVSIAPSNAAFLYSPFTWQITASVATAWNPGAYFRTLFSGSSCTLNFDVSQNVVPLSQIWLRVDNGPWTLAPVASFIACPIPSNTSNADVPFHLLEVWFKSMDSAGTLNRWNAPAQTAIRFLGLTLATGGTVLAPGSAPLRILVFGDSVVEGIRALGEAVSATPDDNDALFSWVAALRQHLGAEVGVVGWGGTGYTTTFANVPVFGTSYASLAAGVSRSFNPSPDLVLINHGTNDGNANIQAAAVAVVNALLAATTCPIVLLNPLPASLQGNVYLAAVPAASAVPGRVHFVSSNGFLVNANGVDSTLYHPSGPNGTALVAPKIAAAVRGFLSTGVLNRWTH